MTSRVRPPGTFSCARCPAVTVMLEAGGADTYTQQAIPGSEPSRGSRTHDSRKAMREPRALAARLEVDGGGALRRPMLSSVSSAALADMGIGLLPPTSSPLVSQEAAEQAALRAMPGRTIREAVLADFSNTHAVPAINMLAWAVALTVPSRAQAGPPAGLTVKPLFMVVFIDGITGAFIMAAGGGRLPPDES